MQVGAVGIAYGAAVEFQRLGRDRDAVVIGVPGLERVLEHQLRGAAAAGIVELADAGSAVAGGLQLHLDARRAAGLVHGHRLVKGEANLDGFPGLVGVARGRRGGDGEAAEFGPVYVDLVPGLLSQGQAGLGSPHESCDAVGHFLARDRAAVADEIVVGRQSPVVPVVGLDDIVEVQRVVASRLGVASAAVVTRVEHDGDLRSAAGQVVRVAARAHRIGDRPDLLVPGHRDADGFTGHIAVCRRRRVGNHADAR